MKYQTTNVLPLLLHDLFNFYILHTQLHSTWVNFKITDRILLNKLKERRRNKVKRVEKPFFVPHDVQDWGESVLLLVDFFNNVAERSVD